MGTLDIHQIIGDMKSSVIHHPHKLINKGQ